MGSCEVWWARVADAGRLLHLLPAADRQRISAFALPADRDRGAVASVLVRALLARRLGVGPADLVIDRSHGRPLLAWPRASTGFSVSHAGDQVVVAITDCAAVGVDVERLGRLSADPAQDAALTRTWVRKEAVVKAAGTGLATPMTSFAVSGPALPPRLLSWPLDPPRSAACTLADLHAEDGYLAALAVFGTGITVTEHDGNALLAERAGRA